MSGFESVIVPVGGARLLRERKRETEEERQKLAMKQGCILGLGCRCETLQFLKKVDADAAGLKD